MSSHHTERQVKMLKMNEKWAYEELGDEDGLTYIKINERIVYFTKMHLTCMRWCVHIRVFYDTFCLF